MASFSIKKNRLNNAMETPNVCVQQHKTFGGIKIV